MVSVGSLEVKGTIETAEIDKGLDRIEDGLQDVKSQSDSTFGSFSNLAQVTKDVAGSFIKIATVGVGAMTALATLSPAVAPSMAKMAIEMRKVSFALGDQLRPLFESVANDLIPAIGTAIERFTPQIEGMVNVGTEGMGDISKALKGEWEDIKNIIPKSTLALSFGAAGLILGGPVGGMFGLAAGWAIGTATTGDEAGDGISGAIEKEISTIENLIPIGLGVTMAAAGWKVGGFSGALLGYALGTAIGSTVIEAPKEYKEKYREFAESMKSVDETWQKSEDIMGEGFGQRSFFRQTLPATGTLLYGSFQTGSNMIVDFFQWLFRDIDEKDITYGGNEKT